MKRARALSFFAVGVVTAAATSAPSLAAPSLAAPSLTPLLCRLSNLTPLAFDTKYEADRPVDGRASFVITCARTQTVLISLVYSHRMKSGTSGPDLTYDLYDTPSHASVWGSGADGAPVVQTFSAGQPTTLYIFARIPPDQQPTPGLLNDSVEIVTMP